MTALEEIKKAEHERIWLEPAGAPDRCWCQDNQWGEEGVEYVLASTLDGAHAEENRLRAIALDMQAGYREAIARAEAAEAEVKLIREAVSELLDQAEHVCLGAHTPLDIKESARNLADPIVKVQTALASTGGEHNGN